MKIFDDLNPKGYVVIKDKDGKILRAHYNTIVNEGKRVLIAKLLQNFLKNSESTEINLKLDDTMYDFHGLCFGSKIRETNILQKFDNEYYEYLEEDKTKRNPLYFTLPGGLLSEENSKDYGVSEFNVKQDKDNNRYYLSTTVRVVPGATLDTDTGGNGWGTENFKNSVCSLAIIMKHRDRDEYRLFSRFRFDPIPINSESEFILTYYIYF